MKIVVTETQKLMLNRIDALLKSHLRIVEAYGGNVNGMEQEELDEMFDALLFEDHSWKCHMIDRFKEVQEK